MRVSPDHDKGGARKCLGYVPVNPFPGSETVDAVNPMGGQDTDAARVEREENGKDVKDVHGIEG
jgi:hypothetical protein